MEKVGGFNQGPETLRISVVDPENLTGPFRSARDYEKAAYYKEPPANKSMTQ